MPVAIVTGSGGLVGGETTNLFLEKGLDVHGIDNDMRATLFGPEASTHWQVELLKKRKGYTHHAVDIRNSDGIAGIFSGLGREITVVVHCAAQPSHDWAAQDPIADFTINANGTLNLLEAARKHSPGAVFIFVSTNKVYGDRPNHLPMTELATRFELQRDHQWAEKGIPEEMPIDSCMHSLFGASKVAADVLVQEYGRYFGMNTGCFRGGCLTGPGHSGAKLHGFLAYLTLCAVTGRPYTVLGYKGKQVRDNIHVGDVANAFWAFFNRPMPGEVFNLGGSRHSNCSMLEAIGIAESLTGQPMKISYEEKNRMGDHIWWVSDVSKFRKHYPEWTYRHDINTMMADIHLGLCSRIKGSDKP